MVNRAGKVKEFTTKTNFVEKNSQKSIPSPSIKTPVTPITLLPHEPPIENLYPAGSGNQQLILDNFESTQLTSHWAAFTKPDRVEVHDGNLLFKIGYFTDWWEKCADAPYILLRDPDYLTRE